MHTAVESLGVDLLHELKPLHGRVFYRCPPYSSGVVNQYIQTLVVLYSFVDKRLYAGVISGIDCDGSCNVAEGGDFVGYGVYG